jgi:heptosyltransferase I
MGTPIIGLYAHHNPERTGPYLHLDKVISVYEEAILEETGKSSRELPWRTRVKDERAMERITSEMVIQKFDQVVKQLLLDKKESS